MIKLTPLEEKVVSAFEKSKCKMIVAHEANLKPTSVKSILYSVRKKTKSKTMEETFQKLRREYV